MRWIPTVIGAGALCVAMAWPSAVGAQTTTEDGKTEKSALTLSGNTALWSMAIRADQTAAFERVMARLRDALTQSKTPERRQQAEGWSVVRLETPLPDGAAVYVHVIRPVVTGADYRIMQILYDEFPDEARELYELYRGAFDRNLSLATGTVAINLGQPESLAATELR